MLQTADTNGKASASVLTKDLVNGAGRDKLVQSEYGITPVSGVVESTHRPHIHPQRYVRGTETQYRGKKHIDPHHMSFSDDAKREAGRCGKRHCRGVPNAESVSEILFYNQRKKSPIEQVVKQPSKTISTSVQLSQARLLKIAQDPRYREAANAILRQPPDASIVQKEEHLSRRIASVEYAKGSVTRCAEMQKQQKALDLGAPSEALRSHTPFAFDGSTPRPDNVKLPCGSYYHNAESASVAVDAVPHVRGAAHAQGGPRDNVVLSQNDYPDPPPVGVRVSARVASRPNPSMMQTTKCLDDELMRHAKARCHQRVGQQMPDFIFGQPPPLHAPHATLRSATEKRWRAEDERLARRRTGKAMTHQSHKPTSLW